AAAGPGVRAQYKCNEPQPQTNQPRPWFKLVNDTAGPVPLAEVTVRYWLADDGAKPFTFWCDYAAIGKEVVTGRFVRLDKPTGDATGYLELSFAPGAKVLDAGADTGEIQCRFARADWSPGNQAADPSFAPDARDWADNPKVTVYRGGKLVWGREPGGANAGGGGPAIPAAIAPPPPGAAADVKPVVPAARRDAVYEQRFLDLWQALHDPKSGYFGAGGLPYHAAETLIIEAPDHGHLTTSEAISYWMWLEAKYGHLTGDWSHLDKAWAATEQHVIPTRQDQPGNVGYPADRPARYAAEWDTPDRYPSKLRPEVPVGRDPIGDELRRAHGTPDVYGMHWLIDVDNWYGFGRRGDGVTAPVFINTFQRGPMESVWATVPHPSFETFRFGGRNGYLDLFTGDDQYSRQWRYTNAPDADARAVQAMFWAHQWAAQRGDAAKVPLDRPAKLGDYLRYAMFDKYFKPAGTQRPEAPGGRGYESAHYLLGWYYAWGGSLGDAAWAWRISCGHAHSGYQNPLAAWALSAYPAMAPKSPNAARDWRQSLDRQMEFYRWLQSADGAIAGGATTSWNGRYDPHPPGASTFHGMPYDWQPVYHDPPSNDWFGMQAWTMTRVAELYYVTGDKRARDLLARWVPWATKHTRLTPDGSFQVPSTLKWTGQPDPWDPARPGANAGLRCEVTAWNQDVGVAGSLARALLYYSAGEKRWTEANPPPAELARALLDRVWAKHRDDKGVSADEERADYKRIFEQVVHVPPGFVGRMPNGDPIAPGVRFIDLRSKYRQDPAFAQVEAAYKAGKPPVFRYHRFWAQVEVALANAAVAELDTGAAAAKRQ
ncbi:MAG TPA: glycoside hydrolase family 48 protein, partial [Humisphaera sp.]